MKFFSSCISLFTEKKCYSCGQLGHFFCQKCSDKLELYKPYCYVCKKPSEGFIVHEDCKQDFLLEQIVVLTRYRQNAIKKLLRHGKYYGKYHVYEEIISNNKSFFQKYVVPDNAALFPVPMHLFRRWKRGYNQTDKITAALSSVLDIPVYNKILYKKKYTTNQSHLSQNLRKINLRNSFGVRKSSQLSKNTTIYLVDDVVSTGSTLCEITQTLRQQGFTDIRAIVLASD